MYKYKHAVTESPFIKILMGNSDINVTSFISEILQTSRNEVNEYCKNVHKTEKHTVAKYLIVKGMPLCKEIYGDKLVTLGDNAASFSVVKNCAAEFKC